MFSQESADDVDNVEPQSENIETGISGYRIYSPSQKRRTMFGNNIPVDTSYFVKKRIKTRSGNAFEVLPLL